jgi:hypothetical protein
MDIIYKPIQHNNDYRLILGALSPNLFLEFFPRYSSTNLPRTLKIPLKLLILGISKPPRKFLFKF